MKRLKNLLLPFVALFGAFLLLFPNKLFLEGENIEEIEEELNLSKRYTEKDSIDFDR